MKRMLCLILTGIMLNVSLNAQSGRFSLSTNLLDYVRLATLNLDASYAVSRHWSLVAGARYNPFTFYEGNTQKQFQYRQQSYAAGARWWVWHTWSGWWLAGKARYQEYNIGGIVSRKTEEGDRIGAGLYTGYTHMLTPHLNIEFGFGMWGGFSWYRTYSCPSCGITVKDGKGWFARPDDLMVSLAYVF